MFENVHAAAVDGGATVLLVDSSIAALPYWVARPNVYICRHLLHRGNTPGSYTRLCLLFSI